MEYDKMVYNEYVWFNGEKYRSSYYNQKRPVKLVKKGNFKVSHIITVNEYESLDRVKYGEW